MTSKKLGALLRSVPPATAGEMQEPPAAKTPASPPDAATSLSIAAEPPPRRPVAAAPAVADPEVPLQVLIPASIHRQLAIKSAEEGESLRALMLRAIRSLGVAVTDAQIAGKRGRRKHA